MSANKLTYNKRRSSIPQQSCPPNARFDLTRGSINSAPRFYKILLCRIFYSDGAKYSSRSGRIRPNLTGSLIPAGSCAQRSIYIMTLSKYCKSYQFL